MAPVVSEVLRSPGQPLDSATRAFMESRFGHDFSRIRVHTDTASHESARSIQARAYTVGNDVVFGAQCYQPLTRGGQRLIAHELTHAVQQCGNSPQSYEKLEICPADGPLERQADQAANQVQAAIGHSALTGIPLDCQCHPDHNAVCTETNPAGSGHGHIEHQYGHDFSAGRSYSDSFAAQSARKIDHRIHSAPPQIALQRAPDAPATSPEKPQPKLSSGDQIDLALSRLEDPDMIWLRQIANPVDGLWVQLITDLSSSNDAQEEILRERARRLNGILREVAPAITSLHQLSDPQKFLPGVAGAIVDEVYAIAGEYAAAIVSSYSDLLIERDLLKHADAKLLALPDFITGQYLSPQGFQRELKQIHTAIFNIGELRGAAGRPVVARTSDDPRRPRLDDILQISFPATQRHRLPIDADLDLAQRSKTKGDTERLLASLAIRASMYGNLAKAGLLYEQFAYWSHLLDQHPVLDSFPARKPDCDRLVAKLDLIIADLETGWWYGIGDVWAIYSNGVSSLEQLLAAPDFNQAIIDIPQRLETIATINRIATVIAITAGAALFAGVAAAGVAASLETAGASALVAGAAEFGTEVLSFTAASRLGQQIAFGEIEGSFAGDLLTNALMFGALKLATLGYAGAFKALADPKVYKVSYAIGKAGTGLATLQIFGEAQQAILTGKAMSGEERYRSIVQNVITLGALEAAGFITKPIQERIGADIAKALGLDKRFATELLGLQKQQGDLRTTFEAMKRSSSPDPKSVQDLLKRMQDLWVKELDLLKRARSRHAISPEQYDASIKAYADAGARLQLQLANLGFDLPGSDSDVSFRRLDNGVVSYTEGTEKIIDDFYKDRGGKLERNSDGTLQGRLPTGEITFYIPFGETPRKLPSRLTIATARDEAARAAQADPIAQTGLSRLQTELMGARNADAVLAAAGDVNALLHALADPGFKRALGARFYEAFAGKPFAIDFVRAYGADLFDSIFRAYGRNWMVMEDVIKRASELLDAAPTPEGRKALHDQIINISSRQQLAALLGQPTAQAPAKPVKVTKKTLGVNRALANWKVFRGEAEKFATIHGENLTAEQIDARADRAQIHELARQGKYANFSTANRISILDRFDELARESNLPTGPANQSRGDLAEALFNPKYGKKKMIFLNGIRQSNNPSGATIPDYDITHSAFTEWVELKSDLIDQGTTQKDGAFDAGVGAAQKYLKDARADILNLPQGDKLSLDFIRDPGAVTRRRMLQILLATDSPVYRVRFGGGTWIDRSAIK
jgi:hypothetical protein